MTCCPPEMEPPEASGGSSLPEVPSAAADISRISVLEVVTCERSIGSEIQVYRDVEPPVLPRTPQP